VPNKVVWPTCDPATVAPINNGRPDMYNYMPTRFVTRDEALAREWKHFYIGELCRYGHKAPRYASNKNICVDCARIKYGRTTIGAKGLDEYFETRPYSQPVRAGTAVALKELEPDPMEKRFLTKYAELRSFSKAAEECGRHESEFLGRLSYSKVFRDAVNLLEEECGLARTPSLTEKFEWSDDKRVVLARTFIDTGNLILAMKAIGVSNYHYLMELETNQDFRILMDKSEEMAKGFIERIGIGLAIDGDSRLLQRVMAVNNPEFGDRMKVDMNLTQKMTDDQINAALLNIARQLGHRVPNSLPAVDAEFTVTESKPEVEASGAASGEAETQTTESNLDLV